MRVSRGLYLDLLVGGRTVKRTPETTAYSGTWEDVPNVANPDTGDAFARPWYQSRFSGRGLRGAFRGTTCLTAGVFFVIRGGGRDMPLCVSSQLGGCDVRRGHYVGLAFFLDSSVTYRKHLRPSEDVWVSLGHVGGSTQCQRGNGVTFPPIPSVSPSRPACQITM